MSVVTPRIAVDGAWCANTWIGEPLGAHSLKMVSLGIKVSLLALLL